jgi:FkbM family methyltransferase
MLLFEALKSAALAFRVEMRKYDVVYSEQARLFHLLRHHRIGLVLDVGANDGEYGRKLRRGGYRSDILSFEPLPAAHAKLLTVAARHPGWHVAPRTAVGSTTGTIDIHVAENSVSSSILPMSDVHTRAEPTSRVLEVERVPIVRLDDFDHPLLSRDDPILLKIDTQGYELEVLKGAERLLRRVQGIQIELSLMPLYDGQALHRTVVDWLAERGFSLWGVMPGFVDAMSGRLLQYDGLFFRDDALSERT